MISRCVTATLNSLVFSFSETLNTKMNWLKNYERIISIEQQLVWQPVTELDPRTFIPEVIIIIIIFIAVFVIVVITV